MSVYSLTEWQAINALGHRVDQDLQRLGVGLTMGGEPTYVSATDLASLQWRYHALGDDKLRLGEQLLHRLQQDLAPPGSVLHHGVGKLYPGEPYPRWALGCFWREDGQPLWQHPTLLSSQPHYPQSGEDLHRFTQTLTPVLGLPPDLAIVAYEPEEPQQPVGYVLPILPVDTSQGATWGSCRWAFTCPSANTDPPSLTLAKGNTPAGMRLPLSALQTPETLATEAQGSLLDPPVQANSDHPLLPNDSIQVALCLHLRRGQIYVFMPPLFAVRGYVDLLTALEQVAHALQQPIVLEGYRPPVNQGIQGFQITPDPGVLEVNIHPASSWSDLVTLHGQLDRAAADCGLATIRYERDGRPVDTGGGAHITLGGPQPEASPILRRPDLLQSFVTYWQHHPSLSYLFAGQYVGPTSQSPRVDEASLDSLDQLEQAFALLDPKVPLPPKVVDHLLHHLLVDITGNTHRAAFCIDKLFPGNNPPLQLGLLELRGFAMPPDSQMRLLQMLLVRACAAWFWIQPYRHNFQRWGPDLHDRFLLPYFIAADLQAVLQDLNQAGYSFAAEWFQPFLEFRCPQVGQLSLPGLTLELRHALEPWPVLADETAGGSTSRPVDDTTERLQIMLHLEPARGAATNTHPILLCNSRPVPMHATAQPNQFVAGLRYRVRSYTWDILNKNLQEVPEQQRQRLENYLKPIQKLRFEVLDGQTHRPLGGGLYDLQPRQDTEPGPWGWPTNAAAAKNQRQNRLTPLAASDCRPPSPIPAASPTGRVTFDLRAHVQ